MAATPPRRHANSGAVKCFRSSRGTISSRPCRTASIAADFVTRSSLCLAWSLTYLSLLKSVTVFLEPPGTSSVSVRVVRVVVARLLRSSSSRRPPPRPRRGPGAAPATTSTARVSSCCVTPASFVRSRTATTWRTLSLVLSHHDARLVVVLESSNDSAGSVLSSSSTENVRQRSSTPPSMSRTVSKLLATSGAISSRSSHAVALPRMPLRNALEKDTGNGDWCNTQYPKQPAQGGVALLEPRRKPVGKVGRVVDAEALGRRPE